MFYTYNPRLWPWRFLFPTKKWGSQFKTSSRAGLYGRIFQPKISDRHTPYIPKISLIYTKDISILCKQQKFLRRFVRTYVQGVAKMPTGATRFFLLLLVLSIYDMLCFLDFQCFKKLGDSRRFSFL